MSTSLDGRYLVARAYTPMEIGELLTRIDAAGSVGELLSVAIRGVFDPLLADCGQTYDDFTPGQRLDPRCYAIPQSHWSAIMGAVTNRASQWGVSAQLGLELVNIFPDSYDDPHVPQPVASGADFRPETVEVRLSRPAADVIANCEKHLGALADFFGHDSDEYVQALQSWHRQLSLLMQAGAGPQISVSRDGPMSLLVSTPSLTYGVLFHGRVRRCIVDGCRATAGNDGQWSRENLPDDSGHEHEPSFAFGAPQPGTWSSHS